MNPEEKLERLVEEYCRENKSRVRSTDDYDRRVHADIDRALEKAKRAESAEQQMNMWRLIMKSKITKYAAAAVIVIGFLTAIIMFTGPETEPGGPVAGSGGGQGDGAFVSDSGQDSDDRLTAESGQIEKMYAAGDVDGLVAMLDKGHPKSKLVAARYLAQIGDERALPVLYALLASDANLGEDNVFSEAIAAIEARTEETVGEQTVEDTNTALVQATAAAAESNQAAEPKTADLLQRVPAESLFFVVVNNLDYALGTMDQFLTGLAPIPMAATMTIRMQVVGLLGDPALNGVDTAANFGLFGMGPDAPSAGEAAPDIFIGLLVPVPDFDKFVAGNANCSAPDSNGVCVVKTGGTADANKRSLATNVGGYLLVGLGDDYKRLVSVRKSMLSGPGIAGSLNPVQLQAATTEALWAHVDIQRASRVFKPLLTAKLESLRTLLEAAADSQRAPAASADIINMYFGMLDVITREVSFFSIGIGPKADLLRLTIDMGGVPGTYVAKMLAADTTTEENPLLCYAKDDGLLNLAVRMNTPFWEEMTLTGYDLIMFLSDEGVSEQTLTQMESLTNDLISSAAGPGVASFALDRTARPPFSIRYVVAVKDPVKWNAATKGVMELWNTSELPQLYGKLGLDARYEFQPAAETYDDVLIDVGRFTMDAVDANAAQAEIVKKIYGEGFDFRYAMVNGLWLCSFGGDCGGEIRELIDQVKAGGPGSAPAEITAAMNALGGVENSEFLGTLNLVRYMLMAISMMQAMQGRQDIAEALLGAEVPTASSVSFSGRVIHNTLALELALPKQHLLEVTSAIATVQQNIALVESRQQATGLEPNMVTDYNFVEELPAVDERRAIEGLATFAEIANGRYPSRLDLATAMKEAGQALGKTLGQALGKTLAYEPNADVNEPPYREDLMEMLADIEATCRFYGQLSSDVAYYGCKVTTESPHAVLLRWKTGEDQYRVILAELTARDVTAERLAELEALPLNLSSRAIAPTPVDGGTAGLLAELELKWVPPADAAMHRVYFGDRPDLLSLLAEVTAPSCIVPGGELESDTTYYWRVDEMAPDGSVTVGTTWSFTTGKLVGWWKFDDVAGTKAADSAGNGHTGNVQLVWSGEPTDSAWDGAGLDGGCINFDGNIQVAIPSAALATINNAVTVCVWVNGANDVQAAWGMPFHGKSADSDYLLYAHVPTGHGTVMFESGSYRAQRLTWEEAKPEDWKGRWNHYAFTLDADAAHIGVGSMQSFAIGCGRFKKGTVCFYKGKLDEVMIYNYALSESQVAAIYDSGIAQQASAEQK